MLADSSVAMLLDPVASSDPPQEFRVHELAEGARADLDRALTT
jgi:hypothetical protein